MKEMPMGFNSILLPGEKNEETENHWEKVYLSSLAGMHLQTKKEAEFFFCCVTSHL
jgi:hypothetical protein